MSYLWLTQAHPTAEKKQGLKPPKPFTRAPIPPGQPHRDRKNDYRRQPKHQKPPE